MNAADTRRIDWFAANSQRVYQAVDGNWWIRPLKADGSVEYNTHPTAGGAARAIGPFTNFRDAVDNARGTSR